MGQGETRGRAVRPPAERSRQDDRIRLLGPAKAGRAGLDAAALGGADLEGAPARFHDAGRARSDREARRSVCPGTREPTAAGARGRSSREASLKLVSEPNREA